MVGAVLLLTAGGIMIPFRVLVRRELTLAAR
jgi:hypothetical protein